MVGRGELPDRPWRDLPKRYRPWKIAHERLQLWTKDGTWQKSWTT
jgi:transposase